MSNFSRRFRRQMKPSRFGRRPELYQMKRPAPVDVPLELSSNAAVVDPWLEDEHQEPRGVAIVDTQINGKEEDM